MEENDVKKTCGGTRLDIKVEKDEKKLKSNSLQNFLFRIWRVVKFFNQNLTRCRKVDLKSDETKFFFSKSCFLEKMFSSKTCLLEKVFSSKSSFLKIFFPKDHSF